MAEPSLELLKKLLAEKSAKPPIDAGGGGGDDPPMEGRVTRLEVEFEHVRRDLDQISAKLDKLDQKLGYLPTKGNLWTMIGTVGGVSLAIIGICVAVLTYLAPLFPKAG